MRRSIMVVLMGVIAALSGFATVDLLRANRCGDLGGRWVANLRRCELPSGEMVGTGGTMIFLVGLAVAAAVLFVLYRALLFATGYARRSAQGS